MYISTIVMCYIAIVVMVLIISTVKADIDSGGHHNVTCTPVLTSVSCNTCLFLPNATYCPRSDVCDADCEGRLLYSRQQCRQEAMDVTALVFSFILLILCPLCIISGCLYMIALRCRGQHKIAVDGDHNVVATTGIFVQEAHHVPVMATAQFINDEEGAYGVQMVDMQTTSESRRVQNATVAVAAVAQPVRPHSTTNAQNGLNSTNRYVAVPTTVTAVATASGTYTRPPTDGNFNV